MEENIEKVALLSTVSNFLLALFKFFSGIFAGCYLLVLDGMHTFIDGTSSILIYAGIRFSRKKESKVFTKRVDRVLSVIVSFLILYGAYEVYKRVFMNFSIKLKIFAVTVTLISIFVNYVLSEYKISSGKKLNSPSLITDGYHSTMDMYSSIVVLIGILGGASLSKIAGIIVVLFIIEVSIELLYTNIKGIITHEESLKEIGEKYGKISKKVIFMLFLIAIISYLCSGFYLVNANEKAVVIRFGNALPVTEGAGLHYNLPYPFGKVIKIDVYRVRREEIGFRSKAVSEKEAENYPEVWTSEHRGGIYSKIPEEALMLTKDENIVDINVVVLWRVVDPLSYVFSTANGEKLLRNSAEASLREIVGNIPIDVILTTGREDIQRKAKEKIQEKMDRYKTGISVISVNLEDVHPPTDVATAFRDVASAKEDAQRYIHDAEAYKNKRIPEAYAQANKTVSEALSYYTQAVRHGYAYTESYRKLYKQYAKYKNITKERLYIDAIQSLLENASIFVIDENLTVQDIRDIRLSEVVK